MGLAGKVSRKETVKSQDLGEGGRPPKASVIVVSWNCRDYLLKCLDSMLSRTRGCEVEWIVVDNASTDGTAEEVERRYSKIRLVVNKKNLGFARANNRGIACSRGEYIFLVNPDVEFQDDCIATLCRFLDTHPDVGVCGPLILNSDGSIQHSCRKFPSLWNNLCFALGLHRLFPKSRWFSSEVMAYFDHGSLKEVDALSGCFLAARRAAIEGIGLLDEQFFMYSEDVDWCKRFREQGWKIVFNPVTKAVHHGGKSSANISIKAAVEQQRAILQYWLKHHSRIETTLERGVLFVHHFLRLLYGGCIYLSGRNEKSLGLIKRATGCIRTALT